MTAIEEWKPSEAFIKWLDKTQEERDGLAAYGATGKPPTKEGQALDSLKAIEMTDAAARLRAEAEKHLTNEKSRAMFEVRKNNPDLNSREREAVVKSMVADVQLVVDACEITEKSCLSRYFNYKGR